MRILLSNDDGYFAPGMERLAAELAPQADITVVAPGTRPQWRVEFADARPAADGAARANGFLFVNGTPTDCVHLAVTGLLDDLPDMVVSGINHGANMGDDTIYSGTVAAATEGYLLGIPSIAVSLARARPGPLRHRGRRRARDRAAPARRAAVGAWLLNVNVPTCRYAQLKGTA